MKLRPTTWPAPDMFDLQVRTPPTDARCVDVLRAHHNYMQAWRRLGCEPLRLVQP